MIRHIFTFLSISLFLFLSSNVSITGITSTGNTNSLNSELFSGIKFRNIGPALTSGRISDIAIHPFKKGTWYVAVGSGGVWKTINAGTTWEPVFDNENSYSIGCVTIDPNTPDIIWVGTGENVSGRHVGYGDGIYKSLNGGKSWENMGLKRSEHIAKIIVVPGDSNIIYAAVEGPLWAPGGDRGLYKSIDGGKSWQLSLFISGDTGVSDIAMEPENPSVLYAAAYQRRRTVAAFMGGGPESGIYKSTDSGKTWRKLQMGLPKGDMGKIGLAISPQKPNIIYATIEASPMERGFYRSEDRGESWEKRNNYLSGGTGPHYYQEIYADPHVFDRVYEMDVWMQVTDDGGKSFNKVGEFYKHSDNHALAFDTSNPEYLIAGCDGGLYESFDRGKTWKYFANLPVTQFYKLALDNAFPFYNITGGTQDNGSQMGPSRTLKMNGIMNSDWFFTLGADGYACAIDPQNPNIIYAEWQIGSLSRYDRKTGEDVNIQPKSLPSEPVDRWNWDSPILISPHSHTRLYFGSQRLYRSDDRGDSWTAISPDLSRGISRLEQPIMGKTWSVNALWDNQAMSFYGNLTSLSESPLKEGLIYAGTDDGLIGITEDGGKNWRKIDSLPGAPSFFFVNDIKASRHDAQTVYVVVDNHKTGDFRPYVYKSSDRGKTWISISGDLPSRHIVWAIAQDHINPSLLFLGTEFGIFFTIDEGKHWIKFTGDLPVISFRDIEIQERENDLVGASFGRGFFILDDYSFLRDIPADSLGKTDILFPVKKALMYIPSKPFNLPGKAFNGDSFYIAPNPPFGAVFTYYLKDEVKTAQATRLGEEKKLESQGKSVNFPGWEALRNEELQKDACIVLAIRDVKGNLIRQIQGANSKGFNRVNWDLRYASLSPTKIAPDTDKEIWDTPEQGPLVVPGTFWVTLYKRIDGRYTQLGEPRSFTVESLELSSLPKADREEILAFQEKAGKLQRAIKGTEGVVNEALMQLEYIHKALLDTPGLDMKLAAEASELEKKLIRFQWELSGDKVKLDMYEPVELSLSQRIESQLTSTSKITETAKKHYELAARDFEVLKEKIKQVIDMELKTFKDKVEAAGAPWTPGRDIPDWKNE